MNDFFDLFAITEQEQDLIIEMKSLLKRMIEESPDATCAMTAQTAKLALEKLERFCGVKYN